MLPNPWFVEFWRLLGVLLLGLIGGSLSGRPLVGLLLAVVVYLAWNLFNLFRLERWLRGKAPHPPEPAGIWGDVFSHLYRIRRRSRRRKKRLTAMLARFRESTAAMPDATVVLDHDGLIEWWNEAATRVLALRYPQDVGQPITNLVRHPDFHEYVERGEFDEPVEFPAPADDKTLLSVRIIPYGNNQRLVVARDVTRMQLLEQMRSDFIANVSHELRTPLTVIAGYLESFLDADDPALQRWERSLRAMQSQASRMQQLVNDLLLLSRLETAHGHPELEDVDVPSLLEMIRQDAEALSQGQHPIELDLDRALWLRGSRGELRSAFSNLVYNAVRYTPPGGRIEVQWYEDARGPHFQVRDTGIGIAPEHIPRLTERFYRVDVGRSRETGGTGLGLAIVKHVLKRHAAELHIDSRVGEGSAFRCDFPASLTVHRPNDQLEVLS